MSDLKELIEATENVTTIDESKAFLQKLERVDSDWHDYLLGEIGDNICQHKIVLAVISDEKTQNTFSEITTSFVYAINTYLKEKRDEFDV